MGRVAKNAMEAARQGLRPIAANKGGAVTQPQTTRIFRGNRESGGRAVDPHTRAFRPLVQRSEPPRTAARAATEEAQRPPPRQAFPPPPHPPSAIGPGNPPPRGDT